MKAVLRCVIALTALAVGFACERAPTGVPASPPPAGLLSCAAPHSESATQVIGSQGGSASSIGPRCFGPLFKAQAPERDRNSNYAVAW